MTTQFPAAIDNFVNPNPSDKLNNPSHSAQHANANDAIEAIQNYLGTVNNPAQGTITDRINDLEAGGGGGGSTIDSVDANEGLTITSSSLGTIYNTLIADTVVSVPVGGAAALPASAWKAKNLVQVLDTILFPDQLPTYTIPTITISSTITGTYEIGQVISPVITTVGSKNDAAAFSAIRTRRNSVTINTNNAPAASSIANIDAQFGYASPNNPNFAYTAAYTDSNFTVTSGVTTWNAHGDYGAGLAKKNNKGVTDIRAAAVRNVNAPQAASTNFLTSDVTVTGIYPYFYGKSATTPTPASIAAAIAAGQATKVLSPSSGTVTVPHGAVNEYIWVAIPAVSTVKTKWFNTDLNQGSIGAGQFILAPVLQNVSSPESRWSAVSFNIYISGYATTTNGNIEYRN